MVPNEAYLDPDKEPMKRKFFEQDAGIPEVSQTSLKMLSGK